MQLDGVLAGIRMLLLKKGWKEQKDGEIYLNGTSGTNFWKDSMILHLSLDFFADEEILEEIIKE